MNRFIGAFLVLLFGFVALDLGAEEARPPFRIAVVGLAHDHAQGFLGDLGKRQVRLTVSLPQLGVIAKKMAEVAGVMVFRLLVAQRPQLVVMESEKVESLELARVEAVSPSPTVNIH